MQASPNQGHLALARFADPERRKAPAPECSSFSFITQNVDGLSGKAFAQEKLVRSPQDAPVLEMHGNIAEPYCTKCNTVHPRYSDTPIAPALAEIVQEVDSSGTESKVPISDLPYCEVETCKGMLRPGVVWFGEVPKHLDEIDTILQQTDLLLVAGTSSTVYPAAGFAARVKRNRSKGKVAVFNLEPSSGDDSADYVFYGPCEETLPNALGV